ncbi:MAG: hypothetical protein ACOX15_01750 [Tepidanaerobacteraceae bacterium]|jgi:hypothetical protein
MQNFKHPRCFCERAELIKNGGFEIRSSEPDSPFRHWRIVNPNLARVSNEPLITSIAYEGLSAASFETIPTDEEEDKSVTLQQNVIATPGCTYKLSFAENLINVGSGGASLPILTARVVYTDDSGNDVDLIIVPILKLNRKTDTDRGYTFHEAVANVPLPCNVSELIVRFDFFVNNITGTLWFLDGVSLRAVSSISACCEDNKTCVIR